MCEVKLIDQSYRDPILRQESNALNETLYNDLINHSLDK